MGTGTPSSLRVATVPFSDQSPIEGALQVATPVTQTERAAPPIPNGASGWHTRRVRVA